MRPHFLLGIGYITRSLFVTGVDLIREDLCLEAIRLLLLLVGVTVTWLLVRPAPGHRTEGPRRNHKETCTFYVPPLLGSWFGSETDGGEAATVRLAVLFLECLEPWQIPQRRPARVEL